MRLREYAVLLLAIAAGIAFAWVDSRPHWDDTGVLAVAMVITGGICGLVAPRLPWLWGLCIGMWIPAQAMSIALLIVIAFPLAGAFIGAAIARASARRRTSGADR